MISDFFNSASPLKILYVQGFSPFAAAHFMNFPLLCPYGPKQGDFTAKQFGIFPFSNVISKNTLRTNIKLILRVFQSKNFCGMIEHDI